MAIHDNDGTRNHEIKKVLDNDGSASHEIRQVFDNDGTTNRLIYNSELILVSSAVEYVKYQTSEWYRPGPFYTKKAAAFDATGYDRLVIEARLPWGGYTSSAVPWAVKTCAIVFVSNTNYSDGAKITYSSDTSPSSALVSGWELNGNKQGSKWESGASSTATGASATLDISKINGTAYLYLASSAAGGGIVCTSYLYKAVAS